VRQQTADSRPQLARLGTKKSVEHPRQLPGSTFESLSIEQPAFTSRFDPMLEFERGSAGNVEQPTLIGQVDAPVGFSDVCSYRIGRPHELQPHRPLIEAAPASCLAVEVICEQAGPSIDDELPEAATAHDRWSVVHPQTRPLLSAACGLLSHA
jgi:hypothetical protein